MHPKTVSVLHTVSSTTVTNQHTRMLSHSDLHMQYKIVSVLHTVSSTTVINTPATKNQHIRCMFYRSLMPALSATRKGPHTPPRWRLQPLGCHIPNHTRMPDTPANCHLSPLPPTPTAVGQQSLRITTPA